jgi:DNA-binding Lrp family transcriptional regulator
MERLARMLESGVIRRIGAVPNHYAIGYTANGMSVWDVPDERIDELGARSARSISSPTATTGRAGCRNGLTTCLPWCMAVRAPRCWPRSPKSPPFSAPTAAHDVLFSTSILKKTGLRIGG